jgi:hypothetical protein
MQLVDTPTPDPDRFARTADGKIDFEAYKRLNATYRTGDLDFEVKILDSRQRFGHLDLLITPKNGAGERWTEFKNLDIHQDPATSLPPTKLASAIAVASAEIEAEPETEPITGLVMRNPDISVAVLTERVEEPNPSPLVVALAEVIEEIAEEEKATAEVETHLGETFTPTPTIVPAMPDPGPHGTHWTEVAPQPVAVATQEVEAPASTDIEDEVAAILGGSSPHIK